MRGLNKRRVSDTTRYLAVPTRPVEDQEEQSPKGAARRSCQPRGCARPAEDKTDRFTILKDWFTSLINNSPRRGHVQGPSGPFAVPTRPAEVRPARPSATSNTRRRRDL
jgi:hypothetical protein